MRWDNILLVEAIFAIFVLYSLRYVKMPRFLMRRKLSRRFPWGYYADQVTTIDKGYIQDGVDLDFRYDLGTEFAGPDGFGDYGEFTGFGQLGEYGGGFFSGGSGGE
jgi:hypothetical protein